MNQNWRALLRQLTDSEEKSFSQRAQRRRNDRKSYH